MHLIMTMIKSKKLSQEEIDEQINHFVSPRFFLKGPIEMTAKKHDIPNLVIDIDEIKQSVNDDIQEIILNNGKRNKRKLF